MRFPALDPVLDPHRCRVCSTEQRADVSGSIRQLSHRTDPASAGGIGPGGADGNVTPQLACMGRGSKISTWDSSATSRSSVESCSSSAREATNVFNLVSLSNPTASLASGNYGKITSAAGTQRIIQVGGRLTF